ncbi:MAG: DUF5666 domain-containing protein [Acidobacteriaceae bacterium]
MTARTAVSTIVGMKPFGFLLCLFLLPSVLYAQDDSTPTVEGYITSISSGGGFDVNGKHIVTTPQTVFWKHIVLYGRDATTADPDIANRLAVGDNVQVFGGKEKHTHSIVASKIVLAQDHEHLSGFAVVQRVVATSPQPILEADGYFIAIPPKAAMHNKPPLTDQTAPAANMWIAYKGKWDKDGLVVADRASLSQFVLSSRMKKGLDKSEGKVVAPNYGTKPGESRKDGEIEAPYIFGKKHTASILAEPALQQRVQQIGERLIPACQKSLGKGDPQKIDFRFYAVQHMSVPQTIGSPDGIVIIPVAVVEQLQNDDQIAAVLAEGIAEAMEWQVPLAATGNSGPTMIALGAMPFVGPIAGIALESGGLYQMKHGTYPSRLDPLQIERVSLSLMHDAGYDVLQAPVAMQILRYGVANDSSTKAPTPQTTYLLSIIGQEYAHGAGAAVGKQQSVAE